MWAHYIVSATRQQLGIDKRVLHTYIEVTGWLVLILIILHPGLLEWQLFHDGLGLPPGSVAAKLCSTVTQSFCCLWHG